MNTLRFLLVATILVVIGSGATSAQNYFDDKVFNKPVKYSVPYTNETCRIADIEVNPAYTVITFEFTTGYLIGGEAGFSVKYHTALIDPATNNCFPLLFATGNMEKDPSVKRLAQTDDPYKFQLVFPSVPQDVREVNLTVEPGLGLSWGFNNIRICNAPRTKAEGQIVVPNPSVKETNDGFKVLEVIKEEAVSLLVQYTNTTPRNQSWRWGKLAAVDSSDGKSYSIDVVGMPSKEESKVYMEKGTTDAAVFCVGGLPATATEIDLYEGDVLLAKGVSLM